MAECVVLDVLIVLSKEGESSATVLVDELSLMSVDVRGNVGCLDFVRGRRPPFFPAPAGIMCFAKFVCVHKKRHVVADGYWHLTADVPLVK